MKIYAKIIADSISPVGIRITTFELQYPRMVHSELMTHRVFSRNAASSRAIPFSKMVEQLTARPFRFGANQSGMQDNGEHTETIKFLDNGAYASIPPKQAWEEAKEDAIKWSSRFHEAGYHKQVVNRLTEPFQMIKVVLTATEFNNFFWLRHHEAADPTLRELARLMYEVYITQPPVPLKVGEWHLPYLDWIRIGGEQIFLINEVSSAPLSLENAQKVSAARCAAVSFRNVDYPLEKCLEVYERLVGADRKHASAFEHQATPMMAEWLPRDTISTVAVNVPHCPDTWQRGISHSDRNGQLWSGNFKGWVQFRKLIPGENHTEVV